jgi:hypothetical protein
MPCELQHAMLCYEPSKTLCQRRIFHEWQKHHVFLLLSILTDRGLLVIASRVVDVELIPMVTKKLGLLFFFCSMDFMKPGSI